MVSGWWLVAGCWLLGTGGWWLAQATSHNGANSVNVTGSFYHRFIHVQTPYPRVFIKRNSACLWKWLIRISGSFGFCGVQKKFATNDSTEKTNRRGAKDAKN